MSYNPILIREKYSAIAEKESEAEKGKSFRVLIPRMFIEKYLQPDDCVLDAAGGAGINAIMMAKLCKKVFLLDITPKLLEIAYQNIMEEGLLQKISLIKGDITDLSQFKDATFSFVVCVGAALSYVLDKREKALSELVRVVIKGSIIIIQVQSKTGMIHDKIRKGLVQEALDIHNNLPFYDGLGVQAHLYTIEEITSLLEQNGCEIVELASTPVFTQPTSKEMYIKNLEKLEYLKLLEYEYCTKSELLGLGHHILVIAKKISEN